jgi:hypothetical protein
LAAEHAELNSDVCAALTHELGGIAGALDLRASAMANSISTGDLAALKALAEEVRAVTRGLRLVRGPAVGALLPSKVQTLEDWWRLVVRFTGYVLPRGVNVDAHLRGATLSSEQSATGTWLWLAACKELAASGLNPPCTVALHAHPWQEGSDHVTFTAEMRVEDYPKVRRSAARVRWIRFAARLAEAHNVELAPWKRYGSIVRWSSTVPRSAAPVREGVTQ